MFTAALFRISDLWNQPRCQSTDEWIKKMSIYMTSVVLFSHKEKWNYVICMKMGRTGDCHAK
jgi:hypothetical protein